ncbi:MAG TPA: cupin domain-containing protein [Pirellulales bacterium]|nr:cupin domain-containing protein [Pirellulales bacterium]
MGLSSPILSSLLIVVCEVNVRHIKTGLKRGQFELLAATRGAQAAKMTLRPGAASDDEPGNEHPDCEQWLFVVSGTGVAVIGKRQNALRRVPLTENSLLLIEKGELHQIKNTGRGAMVTINLYVPPAYNADGDPK